MTGARRLGAGIVLVLAALVTAAWPSDPLPTRTVTIRMCWDPAPACLGTAKRFGTTVTIPA